MIKDILLHFLFLIKIAAGEFKVRISKETLFLLGDDYIRPYQDNIPEVVREGDTIQIPFETNKAVDNTQKGNGFSVPMNAQSQRVELKLKV